MPFCSSGGDLFLVYGQAGRWWTLSGGGVVVSYDNAVPWTLLLPSVVLVVVADEVAGGFRALPRLDIKKQEICVFNLYGYYHSARLSSGRGWWEGGGGGLICACLKAVSCLTFYAVVAGGACVVEKREGGLGV